MAELIIAIIGYYCIFWFNIGHLFPLLMLLFFICLLQQFARIIAVLSSVVVPV